jgi:hypothetical protein
MTNVVIAGILPYIVYAMAMPLCRSTMTSVLGVIIVIAHAFLIFNDHIIGKADYANGIIYYGPILIAVAVIPFVLITINSLKSFKAN